MAGWLKRIYIDGPNDNPKKVEETKMDMSTLEIHLQKAYIADSYFQIKKQYMDWISYMYSLQSDIDNGLLYSTDE